ncbi:RHS repeat-associated core domain-containing protein [Modestobacter marinus]|uniref:RHS repeat-associated core domain-containing protein n=1 Tax=Modestobacter marinus TaxID=477641 RepID=UPI0035D7ECAD
MNQDGLHTADYDYDPTGEVTVTNPTPTSNAQRVNPFRYAGGTYDISSNLIKFGQRWYDPTTGRFTQQDSLQTLADPTRANRYEYANSNPVNYVDPQGRASFSLSGCIGLASQCAEEFPIALGQDSGAQWGPGLVWGETYRSPVPRIGIRVHT